VSATDACPECLRRAWLLGALGKSLDYHRHDPLRLAAVLELDDDDLLAALGNRYTTGLRERHAAFDAARVPLRHGVRRVCRHDPAFPRALLDLAGAPHLLHIAHGTHPLEELLAGPVVAIVGSRTASDYGMEMAWSLARGVASAGITVLGALADGIATSAHAGALTVGGPTLTVMPGGLDVCYPKSHRELYARLLVEGGALSELPCGTPAHRWCQTARTRILATLATVLVVVEARDRPGELMGATMARAIGRVVAAVPGRASSTLSSGPHALLMAGAPLVRDARDVLDLLYEADSGGTELAATGPSAADSNRAATARPRLEPHLHELLELVGAGADTPGKLRRRGATGGDLLVALARLEALGALTRGDGGRYVASGDFHGG
jgi:DNA processing protein